jgi:hypothetical protein
MGNHKVKKSRERPMCKWEEDDKVELQEIGWGLCISWSG